MSRPGLCPGIWKRRSHSKGEGGQPGGAPGDQITALGGRRLGGRIPLRSPPHPPSEGALPAHNHRHTHAGHTLGVTLARAGTPPHHVTLLGDSLSRAHTRRHWCTPAGDLGWGQRGTQTGCPCRRWQRANEDSDQWVSEGAKCDGQNKPVAGVRATEGPASAGGWAPTGPGTEAPLRLEPAGCGGLCERLRVASWVCIAHVCSVCARTHAREAMWHACVSTHGIVCVFLQCMSV